MWEWILPLHFPESHAGEELRYIMDFEKKSNQYAGRLKDVYDAGSNSSVEYRENYPYASPARANNLASQLKLIARLAERRDQNKDLPLPHRWL